MTKPLCSVEGCNRTSYCRTWCLRHYRNWLQRGDLFNSPKPRRSPTLSVVEALRWHGWTVSESGCWEWRSGKNPDGYGMLRWQGVYGSAHRLAYRVWVAPIPEGHVVRHKCDNPPCINPEHLELGTQANNVRDMVERGRTSQLKGKDNPNSKLVEADVRSICKRVSDGESYSDVANDYPVNSTAIYRICKGITWKHLDNEED